MLENPNKDLFFSCDWGTSSFRLRLANRYSGSVIEEQCSEEGIKNTWVLWRKQQSIGSVDRRDFYLAIIQNHINLIEERFGSSLSGISLVISGMASSSIGMEEIPYAVLPIKSDGTGVHVHRLEASRAFPYSVLLVSGLRSFDDVMRGEETQLLGCMNSEMNGRNLFIFPGTHSKHVVVENGEVIDFKTYMTGEFFELLSMDSILKEAVKKDMPFNVEAENSFKKGLLDSAKSNVLHSVFKVRTNVLFDAMTVGENYYYLSGLLIGAELKGINSAEFDRIYLCCTASLLVYYKIAVEVSQIAKKVHIFPAHSAEGAVLGGHLKILNNTQSSHGRFFLG